MGARCLDDCLMAANGVLNNKQMKDLGISSISIGSIVNIDKIYSTCGVRGDVLCNIQNGDPLLLLPKYGVNNIEGFSDNYLELLYYHLRVWMLEFKRAWQLGSDFFEKGDKRFYEWLKNVPCQDGYEREARDFWLKHYENGGFRGTLFNHEDSKYVPKDIESYNEYIPSLKKASISEMDLFSPDAISDTHKKYDVVYIGDLLAKAYCTDASGEKADMERINNSISILTKNLSNLVESGGQVVSTYVSRTSQPLFYHGWQMEHTYFGEMSKAGFAQPYTFALPGSKLPEIVYDYRIIYDEGVKGQAERIALSMRKK